MTRLKYKGNEAIAEAERELGDSGRVLVRAPGTESLIRVMVEGAEVDAMEYCVNRIVEVVQRELAG